MLDNVLKIVKDTIASSVNQSTSIPADKKAQTVEVATHAVANGMKENFTMDNMPKMMKFFGSGNTASSGTMTNNLSSSMIGDLVKKVGLSPAIAGSLATAVIPMIIKTISGKVNDPKEKGFNVESLINIFSGGGNSGSGSGGGGLLSSLGKLFG